MGSELTAKQLKEQKKLEQKLLIAQAATWKKQQAAAAKEIKNAQERVYIPESGHFLLFPAQPQGHEETQISWYSGGSNVRTALYYRMRCWFGFGEEDGKTAFKPLDETIIFVAAEYLDDRYKDMDPFKAYHLLKRSKSSSRIWIRIDESFHYGQVKSYQVGKVTWRWLVYHPAVTVKGERDIYQHRFVENFNKKMAKFFCSVVGSAAQTADGASALAGAVVSEGGSDVIDGLSAKWGDKLRRFEKPDLTRIEFVRATDGVVHTQEEQKQEAEGALIEAAIEAKGRLVEMSPVADMVNNTFCAPVKSDENWAETMAEDILTMMETVTAVDMSGRSSIFDKGILRASLKQPHIGVRAGPGTHIGTSTNAGSIGHS